MDRRSIVLKSISCRGVKSFNLFQKPSTYAIISISAGKDARLKRKQQKQKTSADHEGGENPEWDQTIRLELNDTDFQDTFLEFAIMAQGNLVVFGDKLIGKSRVPLSDLTLGHPSDVVRHVSYQIRSPEGKPNGILSFSYSWSLPETVTRTPPPLAPGIPSALPIEDDSPPLAPPIDDCNPPPVPHGNILYPPLPLPEAGPEECFCYCSQLPPHQPTYYPPPPPHQPIYYPPPPPPPPPASSTGYYTAFERTVSPPVLSRDVYFSTPLDGNVGYHPPPMPAFGTYYASSAPGYIYPPPQDSCGYWNCK
ncbi:leucine-rich repeat extensin-like protein 3 isoform X1 [Phalaenopsis equestris]|uniref:leucine-rich repeat extensin-like protein 3 isoform X1 n=1 Tax=Phalaenopsis equestris TaxID=78828 RepID=UPI0009E38C38|nr:leucine-rich repeat extensin-like protein 3 isoform X1 [Phalaenopsis equestris]